MCSFTEAYYFPVGLRSWMVTRLNERLEKEEEAIKNRTGNNGGAQTPLTEQHLEAIENMKNKGDN